MIDILVATIVQTPHTYISQFGSEPSGDMTILPPVAKYYVENSTYSKQLTIPGLTFITLAKFTLCNCKGYHVKYIMIL